MRIIQGICNDEFAFCMQILMFVARAPKYLPRIKRASTTTSDTIVKRSVCMNAALYGHCGRKGKHNFRLTL